MEEKFSFEENLLKIRDVVSKMQEGIQNFDQQIALFKEGNQMIKQCQDYLDASELEIKQLINGNWESMPPVE